MRNRRRYLLGSTAVLLTLLAATTPASAAQTPTGRKALQVSANRPVDLEKLTSEGQKPFLMPQSRPTEDRQRPTDVRDPNRNAYSVPESPTSPACSRHFCVHWVDQGLDAPEPADADGDGVPDFVERVLRVAERVHSVENGRLGWREPRSDGRQGGRNGKTDVYLSQIGGELFGYAAPDRGQATKQHRIPRRLHGYLVLDNDYSAFEFPGTKPLADLQVTFAHEYNHILQFGYDAYQDPWFAEASATWVEDQVYNGINDYLRYVRRWVRLWETPLTTSSIKEYGSAVWNQWLARRYGPEVVRKAWAGAIDARPGGFSVGSYERALRSSGPSDFSHDFARFAAALPEWRTGKGFRESRLYPDPPRQGRLPLDGTRLTRLLNHTTFQLLRVRPRRGRAVAVHLTAPRGTAAGVALVGRTGSERHGHPAVRLAYAPGGGSLTVRLRRPGRFKRITAVIINADARAGGFNVGNLDWNYLTDGLPFRVSGRLDR
ncbi:MAG TPA: MXAN_6640 family putative metalloprotease [Solirubrobacterales bacterium]|nr:MXAN_6640 family putative metalloprotease [Solirubrobacterales bacterium]